MLKRIALLMLCAMMLLPACAPNPTEDDGNAGENATGEPQVMASIEPTPEPTSAPTPFPAELVEDETEYGFVCSESELLYSPEEGSGVIETLDADTDLEVTGTYEDYFRVDMNGTEGLIKKNDLAIANGYLIADEVNLRAGAGLDEEILMKTPINTTMSILERTGEWYKVVLDDEESTLGYIHFEYVDFSEGYITKNGVNMRSMPDTEAEAVTQLMRGNTVSILCEYDGWYSVETDEFEGYVKAEFVQEAPIVVSLEKQRGYINESGVNFRKGPATGFDVIDKLYKFSPVYITGETEDWYRVILDEQEGYVSKDFVEFGTPKVYVTAQDVNLRAGPGTGTDILTKVRQNSEFVIIGQDGAWMKGEVNGNVGYIRSDYLSTNPIGDGEVEPEFSEEDILLAARVAYLEAKGSGYDGYAAVVNVIYNRVKSRRFPNTVRGVIYQKNQFSVVNHSQFETLKPNSTAMRAARDVLNGGVRPLPLNVLFFFAGHLGTQWGSDKEFYGIIGANAFFRYVG